MHDDECHGEVHEEVKGVGHEEGGEQDNDSDEVHVDALGQVSRESKDCLGAMAVHLEEKYGYRSDKGKVEMLKRFTNKDNTKETTKVP